MIRCPEVDLNHRHMDFQSITLPLSYPDYYREEEMGFEPMVSVLETLNFKFSTLNRSVIPPLNL